MNDKEREKLLTEHARIPKGDWRYLAQSLELDHVVLCPRCATTMLINGDLIEHEAAQWADIRFRNLQEEWGAEFGFKHKDKKTGDIVLVCGGCAVGGDKRKVRQKWMR